jgi:tRNA/tmRNA/rRNA uracil-C5-methylase (TrmA/RlmC/RlmD family)
LSRYCNNKILKRRTILTTSSGEVIKAKIEKVILGGDGLARLDSGEVLFVPFTLPIETVNVRIVKKQKNLLRGEVAEVTEPSSDRVEPKCPYFGKCGGCQYQHIKYEAQCKIKREQTAETLTRIGRIPENSLHSILQEISPSKKEWEYRNRITLHKDKNEIFGYYSTDNETIIAVNECPISNELINSKLKNVEAIAVEAWQKNLVISGFGPEWTNIITNETRASILDKVFAFGPKCFIQANVPVFEDILKYVLSESVLPNGKVLLELYCGIGVISILASGKLENVYSSDINSDNIGYARKNAERHGVKNIHFSTADAADALVGLAKRGVRPDIVILDPPRDGVSMAVIAALAELKAENIIYISCDPATFARDVARLSATHSLISVKPFDMFPQTAHIELAGVFKVK